MLVSSGRGLCVALVAVTGFGAAPARAQSAASSYALQACALAYENSQQHRREGALSVARSELARCSQDDCPGFIRTDCAQWAKEAEAEQPSVLFLAKREGRDLSEVRVSNGDRVLVERLPNPAIELDPGSYELQFETPGSAAVQRHVVLRSGDKGLVIQVDFATLPEHSTSSNGALAAARSATVSMNEGPRVLPWVLLGVGAASLGAGVGFAAWGHSNENHLRAVCSPNCTGSEVQPVRTKYLLGDLSFGVGLASVSFATYLLLSQRASDQAAESALPVNVAAGPSGVFTSYGARF